MWNVKNVIFLRCYFLIYSKQWLVRGVVCMLLFLETGIKVPQGMVDWVGTNNFLPRANCWLCMGSLKSLLLNTQVPKNVHETLTFCGIGAHPANHLQMQATSLLEIVISIREDDKLVNENMDTRCVLETGRSRGVMEVFRCRGRSNLTKGRNLPENNCAIWVPAVLSKGIYKTQKNLFLFLFWCLKYLILHSET